MLEQMWADRDVKSQKTNNYILLLFPLLLSLSLSFMLVEASVAQYMRAVVKRISNPISNQIRQRKISSTTIAGKVVRVFMENAANLNFKSRITAELYRIFFFHRLFGRNRFQFEMSISFVCQRKNKKKPLL